jgi:hypothetical protein
MPFGAIPIHSATSARNENGIHEHLSLPRGCCTFPAQGIQIWIVASQSHYAGFRPKWANILGFVSKGSTELQIFFLPFATGII